MSIDDQLEQNLYNAISAINSIPRTKERERILREAIDLCGRIAGWETFFARTEK